MGSWRKMGAFLGLVPEDEAREGSYEGDYEPGYPDRGYQDGYATDRAGTSAPSRGAGYAEPLTRGALAMQVQEESRAAGHLAPPAAAPAGTAAARPQTVKLTGFGEARIIGERFRDGASVILDMTDLTDADARRVVDFAAGLAFALRGSIDKVTTRVFMLLPPDADMSAEDRRAFAGHYAAR